MPKFIIVDPNLVDFQGHHFEYCQSVAEAAIKSGLETWIVANAKCGVGLVDGLHVQKCFRVDQWHGTGPDWMQDLDGALQKISVQRGDHVFVHTIFPQEFAELVNRAIHGKLPSGVNYHLLFRRDALEYGAELLTFLGRVFQSLHKFPNRFFFYTDTDQLRDQYNALGALQNKRFRALPIPFRHSYFNQPNAAAREDGGAARSAPLSFAYFGDARSEKGFHHLPAAVGELVRHEFGRTRPQFLIQCNFNLPGGEPGMADAVKRLHVIDGVRLLYGPFSPEDYYDLLTISDIIVLPYDQARYPRRSSGVLSEAMLAGKVVVVPSDTWLSSQVDSTRAVVFDKPGDLGAALVRAGLKFAELREKAEIFAATYRAKNTPDALLAELVNMAAT